VEPERRARLESLRREYETTALDLHDIDADPIVQLAAWLDQWVEVAPNEPGAMVLSTAAVGGGASSRNVLLRGLDARGLTFFTSYESRKSRELTADPRASLLFSWLPVLRQVQVVGVAERTTTAESEAYFASRPRGSQLAAWASHQSSVLPDRATLEARYREADLRFADVEVPCPPHWGGWRLVPTSVELWQGRSNRLHDRLRYVRDPGTEAGWRVERLSP